MTGEVYQPNLFERDFAMRVIGQPSKSGGLTRKTKKVLKENKEAQERLSIQTAKPILQKKEDK